MTPTGPLSGIRVLDLTSVLFGPYAAQMLGDWGADVIKVEPPAGDTWRYTGVFRNRGMSGQFMAVNRNKRSLALDLKHPDGKGALAKLIPTVDALVTNVRPAAMARLGFGYEACAKLNPRLIYAAATGFGQDGPWAARPAFDEIIQAASGLASSIGSDEEPEFVPSLIGDKICAMAMVGAVSSALFRRERSGQGQMVEVPMLETIAGFNSIEMLGGHAFDPPIGPTGYKRMKNRRPVQTKDGWLTMLPYSGDNWCAFFEAVGRPELIEELGVRDPVLRSQNIDKVYDRMSEIGPPAPLRSGRNCCCGWTCRTPPSPGSPRSTSSRISPPSHCLRISIIRPKAGSGRRGPRRNSRKARPASIAWRRASASTRARCCARPA